MVTGEDRENYWVWWQANNTRFFSIFDLFYGFWFQVYLGDETDDHFIGDNWVGAGQWYWHFVATYGSDRVESKYTPAQRRQWLNSAWNEGSCRTGANSEPTETDECSYNPTFDAAGRPRFNGPILCNGCCDDWQKP